MIRKNTLILAAALLPLLSRSAVYTNAWDVDLQRNPPAMIDLWRGETVALGYYDISGGRLDANTKIPFADVYQLPRAVTIFAAINVIGYTSDWVAAPLASTAVTFKPQNMHLHIV